MFKTSLLGAALALALPVQAQSRLDPVVVTATRSPQALSTSLADVQVLERSDIERLGPGGLVDLLRRVAGIEFSRNGGPAAATSLYLRGAETRHTVVLLDGVRIDSQATGGASWPGLPLAQIERIEIVSGPLSSIYGSDAIGGVIQLFTRQGERGLQGEARLAAGNLGQRQAEASVRGGDARWRYSLGLAQERADGFNASTDPTSFAWSPDRDGWQRDSAQAQLNFTPQRGQRLSLSATALRSRSQFDGFDPDADDRDTQRQSAVSAQWQAQWSPQWHSELQLGQSRDRYAIPNFFYDTDTRVRQAALQLRWLPAPGEQGQLLLERREDRLSSADVGVAGSAQRRLDSLGLGWLRTQAGHTLQAQWRHDRDAALGGTDTGLLGASLALPKGWRLAGSVGTGFRAPTVYQLASPYGQAKLRPERSRNAELALRWQGATSRAALTHYRQAVRELIVFGDAGPCASPFGCYGNAARARLQGWVLSAEGELAGGWQWRGNLNQGRAQDLDRGLPLPRRARTHGRLGLSWADARWQWGAHLAASGKRWDDSAATRRLAGYAQLDLDARWHIQPGWALEAQLVNATDRRYALAAGYAVLPRSLLLGVRAKL